jgi:cobalamin biosynthesis protein CobD/CbiB
LIYSTENYYGCYGVLVAIAIIFLLIIGCVPVFLATKNISIIFTVISFTILVIGVFIYFYFEWQIQKARIMHERTRRGEIEIERVYVAVKSTKDDRDDKKLQPGKMKSNKSYNVNTDGMTVSTE